MSVARLVVPVAILWPTALAMLAFGRLASGPVNRRVMVGGGLALLGLVVTLTPLEWTRADAHLGWVWPSVVAVVWLVVALWTLRSSRGWVASDRERRPDGSEAWWSRRRLAAYVAIAHLVGTELMVVMAAVR